MSQDRKTTTPTKTKGATSTVGLQPTPDEARRLLQIEEDFGSIIRSSSFGARTTEALFDLKKNGHVMFNASFPLDCAEKAVAKLKKKCGNKLTIEPRDFARFEKSARGMSATLLGTATLRQVHKETAQLSDFKVLHEALEIALAVPTGVVYTLDIGYNDDKYTWKLAIANTFRKVQTGVKIAEVAKGLSAVDPDLASAFVSMAVKSASEHYNRDLKDDAKHKATRKQESDAILAKLTEAKCANCRREQSQDGKPLRICSKCKCARYCGAECQKAHWKIHKVQCVLNPYVARMCLGAVCVGDTGQTQTRNVT